MSGICRWLSAYGWSNGVKSISSPLDFRIRVGEGMFMVLVSLLIERGIYLSTLNIAWGKVRFLPSMQP